MNDSLLGAFGAGSRYELILYDSAGDGWDGANYFLRDVLDNYAELYSGTLDQGQQKQVDMCLSYGCYQLEVTSGDKDSEVSWFIGDADLSGGAPSTCQFNVGPPNPSCPKQCLVEDDDEAVPKVRKCTSTEKLAGAVVVSTWTDTCTDPKIKEKDWEDKDLTGYDWQELDDFEACAFNDKYDGWPDSCMALEAQAEDSDDSLVAKLSSNLEQASTFCSCIDATEVITPNCRDFQNFLELLRESGEACNALDAIDCAYLETFVGNCLGNLVDEFGTMDFSDPDQCTYVDEGCGGLPEPYFRHWDCLDPDQLTPAEATFLASYQQFCLAEDDEEEGDDDDKTSTNDDKTNSTWGTDDGEKVKTDDNGGSTHGSTSDSAAARTAAAVGSTFGVLAFIGCGVAAVWYVKKRRNKSEGYQLPELGMTTFSPMVTNERTQQQTGPATTPTDFRTLKAELETPPGNSGGADNGNSQSTGYIPVELE